MNNSKTIIDCPKCGKRLRIPQDKHIYVTCPDCSAKFEFKNGINVSSIGTRPFPLRKRLINIIKKIAIATIIVWSFNFLLLKTGWTKWEYFSQDADNFAESVMQKTAALSPFSLLNHYSVIEKTGPFNSKIKVGKKEFIWNCSWDTINQHCKDWIKGYWYTESGGAFWPGRIILIIISIITLFWAIDLYAAVLPKLKWKAIFVLLFNIVYRFFLLLFWLSVIGMLLFFTVKILLFVAGGLVALFTILAAAGGFLKILADEIKQDAIDQPKKRIIDYLFAQHTRKK